MKFIISLFLSFLLLSCASSPQTSERKPIDLIPASSLLVIQSKDLAKTFSDLSDNSLIQQNQNLPVFKSLVSQVSFFKDFKTSSKGVICFSAIGKKDLATTYIGYSEDIDFQQISSSITNRKTFAYEGKEINEFTWKDELLFAVWFDDIVMVSDSKLIIENKIRDVANGLTLDESFSKVLKTVDTSYANVFIQVTDFKRIYQKALSTKTYALLDQLTDWVALDFKTSKDGLQLSGISTSEELHQRKFDLLSGQPRIVHGLAALTPLDAIGFESYGISDFEVYINQRKKQNLLSTSAYEEWFQGIEEVGKIHFPMEDVVVLKRKNERHTMEALNALINSKKEFRDHRIVELKEGNLLQIYEPLVSLKNALYMTQINEFYVFATTTETLENLLINHANGFHVSKLENYQAQYEKLSTSSSAMFYLLTENWAEQMQDEAVNNFQQNLKEVKFSNYKGLLLQVNVDYEYAYVNALLEEVEPTKNTSLVKQKSRFKLPFEPLSSPRLFTNWRTKQRDLFVQDQNLMAHLLDADGNTLWSTPLKDVMVGDFMEFDIYKNTRLQLAFATQQQVHVIDKNGKEVAPFPISFSEKITQPLAIFDYDNNGNYRLMVCQGKKLRAYDKGGNLVKGFEFSTKTSEISQPPKHYRIGKKDFILVQEAAGTLHILDRRGQVRVNYSTSLSFSGQPWYVHDGKFTSTTAQGDVVQISPSGKVSVLEKNLSENHRIVANERLLVTLSSNELHINEVSISLANGMYTTPQIIQAGTKAWVALTDKEAKKLYVFDENGTLVQGFPVVGNSSVDYFSNDAMKVQLMVSGEEGSILMYEIN